MSRGPSGTQSIVEGPGARARNPRGLIEPIDAEEGRDEERQGPVAGCIRETPWEPSFDAAAIGDGIVMLSGHAPSYTEQEAAQHVQGVRAVVNDIEVRLCGIAPGASSDSGGLGFPSQAARIS